MSTINRLYKDRLFRLLFADEKNKANALALYNALNNSNYTNVDDLEFNTLERCRPLYEYTTLISRIQTYKELELSLQEAVDKAVDDCIRDNILVEFLTAHRMEVLQLFLEELDEKFFIAGVKQEALLENLKKKIQKKIAKGLPLEQIASELEENIETIQPLYDELIYSAK